MKRLLFVLFIMIYAMSGTAMADSTSPRRIIIDTDTGADDASALILASLSREVKIEGVTVLAGNVDLDKAAANALASLELTGAEVPVYKGSDIRYDGTPINPSSVFGSDGMGDKDLVHPKGAAEEEDAVDFILDTVRSSPGEIEIVMLGPATNIARAIDKDKESMKQVKRIWSMGTTGIYGPGNASPVSEFNVYLDPHAYSRILDSGIPLTVIGLDVCDHRSKWTDTFFDKLARSGDIGGFLQKAFSGIMEFYAGNGSAGSVMNCDGTAMLCVICPDYVTDSRQCHGSCICTPGETYGQVIFYQKDFQYDLTAGDFDYNVTLICGVDQNTGFKEYLSRIKLPDIKRIGRMFRDIVRTGQETSAASSEVSA